jgi:hypothetical protein
MPELSPREAIALGRKRPVGTEARCGIAGTARSNRRQRLLVEHTAFPDSAKRRVLAEFAVRPEPDPRGVARLAA